MKKKWLTSVIEDIVSLPPIDAMVLLGMFVFIGMTCNEVYQIVNPQQTIYGRSIPTENLSAEQREKLYRQLAKENADIEERKKATKQ